MFLRAIVTFLAVVLALLSYLYAPIWCHMALCILTLIPIFTAKLLMATKPSLSNKLLLSWYIGYILLTAFVGHLSILASIAVSGMFSDRTDAKFLTDYLGGGVTALFATLFFEPFENQEGGFWPRPMFRRWFEASNPDLALTSSGAAKRAFDAVYQDRVYDEVRNETLVDGWSFEAREKRARILEEFNNSKAENTAKQSAS